MAKHALRRHRAGRGRLQFEHECQAAGSGSLDVVLRGGHSQFVYRPALDLPDPLFGHAHRGADLFQGLRFLAASQAETTGDDLPLPLVEPVEDPLHLRLPLDLSRLLLVLVRADVLGGAEISA